VANAATLLFEATCKMFKNTKLIATTLSANQTPPFSLITMHIIGRLQPASLTILRVGIVFEA